MSDTGIGRVETTAGPIYLWLQTGFQADATDNAIEEQSSWATPLSSLRSYDDRSDRLGYSIVLCQLEHGCLTYRSNVSAAEHEQQDTALEQLLDESGATLLPRLQASISAQPEHTVFKYEKTNQGCELCWCERASSGFEVVLCKWSFTKQRPSGRAVGEMLHSLCTIKRKLLEQKAAADSQADIIAQETQDIQDTLNRLRRRRKVDLDNIKQRLIDAVNEVKADLRHARKMIDTGDRNASLPSQDVTQPSLRRRGSLTRQLRRQILASSQEEVDLNDTAADTTFDSTSMEQHPAKRRKTDRRHSGYGGQNRLELSMLDDLDDL